MDGYDCRLGLFDKLCVAFLYATHNLFVCLLLLFLLAVEDVDGEHGGVVCM